MNTSSAIHPPASRTEFGKRRVTGLILLIVLPPLLAWVADPFIQNARLRLTNVVVPHGSRTMNYVGKPFIVFSVIGERRFLQGEAQSGAAAFNLFVVLPAGSFVPNGSLSESNDFIRTDAHRWINEQGASYEFRSTYDTLRQVVTIGKQEYSLADGNLFVVRLDGNRQPQVTPLAARIDVDDHGAVVRRLKSLLPDNEVVQSL